MKSNIFFLTLVLSISFSYSTNVKFHNVNDLYGVSMRETASICKDNNGFIWTSSKTGIMRISDNDCRIYSIPYRTTDIINVKLVYNNNFLIAYSNNGQAFRYNAVHDRFDFLFHLSILLGNRHLVVSSIIIDNQGDLWISSSMGLHHYQNEEITQVEKDNTELFSIKYDENHILFIRSDEIYLLNLKTKLSECILKNSFLSINQITTPLFYDAKENRLWISSPYNSLFFYDFNDKHLAKIPIHSFQKQLV